MIKSRVGAPKRIAVGTLAAAVSLFGVALAPSVGATASVTTARIAGTDRYDTAGKVATDASLSGGTTAILATGENFPDALAASGLAGANAPAPIVLTQAATYTPTAKAALATLKGKGVVNVTIVGGTDAVSATVATAVTADGFTVTRLAGNDRFETASAIATAQNTKKATGSVSGLKAAFIATGANFPDALAGGPAAYSGNLPILLVQSTGVPASTTAAITALGIKKVYILGGTDAVPATVEATLVTQTGNPATRLAGVDRNETATKVADFEKASLGFVPTEVILATGNNFPDALADGPLAGQRKAPILLTASIPPATAAWLDANSSTISKITATGGTDVISDADLAAAQTSAQNTSNDSAAKAVTTRPELTGASIVGTTTATQVTPTNPIGTTVRYTFDETLGFTPSATLFKVYNSSAPGTAITGSTAVIESTAPANSTTVLVTFSSLATTASTAGLTKATVAFGAVKDVGGAENPEGDAPIGTAGTTPSTAGTTSAPDLVSVSGFRQGSVVGTTAVDFTFDQAAFTQSSASAFHLVDTTGTDATCTGPTAGSTTTSGGTIAGGDGTTVITVTCVNIGGTSGSVAGTAYSTSNVARGYVAQGSIGSNAGGSSVTPLEAADVNGSSLTPDLVSVSYSSTTGFAVFTFDEPVSVATATAFHLYTTTGVQANGTASSAVINSGNASQVQVTFAAATSGSYVGGSADSGGTLASSAVNTAGGTYNRPDEEGFAASSTTLTPGRTAGPDLISVAITATLDTFGNTTGYGALYTFDSADTSALTSPVSASFHLYLNDGTRYNGGSCIAGTGSSTTSALNTVKCTGFVNSTTLVAPTVITTLQAAVLGTNEAGAITSTGGAATEGAAPTTGGTGTAAK